MGDLFGEGKSPSGSDPSGYRSRDQGDTEPEGKYSLFNLKRMAAPVMGPATQRAGTPEQQAVSDAIFGPDPQVPWRQRIRDRIAEHRENRFAAFKQAIFDQFYAAKEIGRRVGSRVGWDALHLTKNIGGIMSVVLKTAPMEVYDDPHLGKWLRERHGWTDGGYEATLEGIADKEELRLYETWKAAVRAQRLKREGREHLMTDEQIATMKASDDHPHFKHVLARQHRFNAAMVQMLRDAGVITRELADIFLEHGDHTPFFRILVNEVSEQLEVKGPHKSGPGGPQHLRSPLRRLMGGTAKLNNLTENEVRNYTAMVDRAVKNLARRKVLAEALQAKAVEALKGWEWWTKARVKPEEAQKALEDIGVEVASATPEQKVKLLEFWQMSQPTDPSVYSQMVDGKPEFYRVKEPLLLQAMLQMGPAQMDAVLKTLNFFKRGYTRAVTTDPAYMGRNVVRDTLAAWVMYSINPLNSVKGALQALHEDDLHRVAIMAAGGGRGFYATDPRDVNKFIDKHVGTCGGKPSGYAARACGAEPEGKLFNAMNWRDWWDAWQKVGAASEKMADRIARYRQVMAQGGSEAEAAFEAQEMLDFGMHGASPAVQNLIAVLPFFNARIQGLYKLGRRARENPKRSGFQLAGETQGVEGEGRHCHNRIITPMTATALATTLSRTVPSSHLIVSSSPARGLRVSIRVMTACNSRRSVAARLFDGGGDRLPFERSNPARSSASTTPMLPLYAASGVR